MAEILHEQEGLTIRKNDINKFVVCRLHYTADPAKRSDWWKEEAAAGMTPAKFQQEYEISYTAMFGQRVFPEIEEHKSSIVISRPYPDISKNAICYAGLDFGLRNPTSVHVYTILKDEPTEEFPNPLPYYAAIWEHYEPTENMTALAEALKACPYWEQVKWVAADPSLFSTRGADASGLTRQIDQFIEAGIRNVIEPPREEEAWLSIMRDHWRNLEHRPPTFRIFDSCYHMIREFEGAIFQEMSEALMKTRNYKEKIVDKNNHALDDCKYFMLAAPRIRTDMRIVRHERDFGTRRPPAWERYRQGSRTSKRPGLLYRDMKR